MLLSNPEYLVQIYYICEDYLTVPLQPRNVERYDLVSVWDGVKFFRLLLGILLKT